MACNKDHGTTDRIVKNLPIDQGGIGRHICAACAYEQGFADGFAENENIELYAIIGAIEDSQKGHHRHRSPIIAYMLGYLNGSRNRYKLTEFTW